MRLQVVEAHPTVQQNFDAIGGQFPLGLEDIRTGLFLQLVTAGTARKISFGLKAVTFTAAGSVVTTVTHGLGTTPVWSGAAGAFNTTAAFDSYVDNPNAGSTTFPLTVAVRGGAAVSTTINIPWISIG